MQPLDYLVQIELTTHTHIYIIENDVYNRKQKQKTDFHT